MPCDISPDRRYKFLRGLGGAGFCVVVLETQRLHFDRDKALAAPPGSAES